MSESAGAAPDRWLAGPVPDLVLGCGLGYLAWVALLWIPGVSTPLLPWIPFGTGLLALVTATPHYGATLLRVYEQRSDRRRYAFFALYATFVIAASFVGAVYWLPLGSLLVTLYVTWSPWHFAGQNYGLASMFLRRRGIGIDAGTRRLLYACFALSFVLAFLALHRGEVDLRVAPVPVDIYGPYEILSLGLPAWLVQPAFWAVSFAYVGALLALAVARGRRARAIDQQPTALRVALPAVWVSIPAWLAFAGSHTVRTLALATVWISIAHAIQ
jgi:hypothetical protein